MSSSDSIAVRTQSPASSVDQAAIRGITNTIGSNSCFLNCAVQALWNLDPFRVSFVLLKSHECTEGSCIFCAFTELASNYQFHEQGPINPDVLREALAAKYHDANKFQIGFMEDAAECFEGILYNLHVSLTSEISSDGCTGDLCISHRLLSMSIIEQDVCGCGATSEPLSFDQYIYYVSAASVVETFHLDRTRTFAHVLKASTRFKKQCPNEKSKCKATANVSVSLVDKPDVFCVGFAWPNDITEVEFIETLMNCIEDEIDLDEVFDNVASTTNNVFKLVGIMVYYGHHYFTFFFHSGIHKWLLYDDASVKEIGTKWKEVKQNLIKGKYQPLVLLYCNPSPDKVFSKDKKSAKASNSFSVEKFKLRHKNRLTCLSPTSPVDTTSKKAFANNDFTRGPVLIEKQASTASLETPPPPYGHDKNLIESMITGVEGKIVDGLSFLGLKDVDKMNKKRFIHDCTAQADKYYADAKVALGKKDYVTALDLMIEALNFYTYIRRHEDSSSSQKEKARIRGETARLNAKRISVRIPANKLTEAQLDALYERCPLCDNFREDGMKYCFNCTKYCSACNKIIDLTSGGYCDSCSPQYLYNSKFEGNLRKAGYKTDDIVWYDAVPAPSQPAARPSAQDITISSSSSFGSPPPYESLQKQSCMICNRVIVTNKSICSSCSTYSNKF